MIINCWLSINSFHYESLLIINELFHHYQAPAESVAGANKNYQNIFTFIPRGFLRKAFRAIRGLDAFHATSNSEVGPGWEPIFEFATINGWSSW